MKVNVKLYGTLGRSYPAYDPVKGLTLEFSNGVRVKDVLNRLKIPGSKKVFVSINNRIAKPDDKIPANGTIIILQALAGG